MKKLICIFAVFMLSLTAFAENEPTLILEVHAKTQAELKLVTQYANDTTFCCLFDVQAELTGSEDSYTKIIHKETGIVLGTVHGTPSKQFILKIYKEFLTPAYIDKVVGNATAAQGRL